MNALSRLGQGLRLTLVLWLLTVVVITLPLLGLARLVAPDAASGSLLRSEDGGRSFVSVLSGGALGDALPGMARVGGGARMLIGLAGGQTLLATLNMRLSEPTVLIDITGLAGLRGITLQGNWLHIGALATHTEIETSALVAEHAPLLAAAAPHIAHRAIRNCGTWGGSIAYGDPAAEWPCCLVALEGVILVQGPEGGRQIAATDFFHDLYTTALQPHEIVTGARVPVASAAGEGVREAEGDAERDAAALGEAVAQAQAVAQAVVEAQAELQAAQVAPPIALGPSTTVARLMNPSPSTTESLVQYLVMAMLFSFLKKLALKQSKPFVLQM
jgi:CO/xanthine dehydrogenase FAD-binding subunit